jgi:hypothetical protein
VLAGTRKILIVFAATEGELPRSGKRCRPEACASKKHFSRSVCHSRPKGGKAQSEVQLSQKSGSAAFLKY